MFLLPYQPKSYPTQPRFRYCSAYQIAAIASAHGREISRPHDVLSGFAKVSGFCLPGYLHDRMRGVAHKTQMIVQYRKVAIRLPLAIFLLTLRCWLDAGLGDDWGCTTIYLLR